MDIMQVINEQVANLKKMRQQMQDYEEQYMLAKADYETANEILARQMAESGILSCITDNGSKVEVIAKVSCSIKQDHKHDVANWLRKLGMAEKVKVTATVQQDYISLLDKAGVEYQETEDVNTNTVKSILTGMIQEGKVSLDRIPKGITYSKLNTVKIDGQ